GLAGIVRVLEPSEDVRSLYAAADVFVSASGEEGMPYSVAEALACGTSVVASDLPGHALIGGGLSACRLVDPDPAVLAGAIAAQLDRPSQVAAADAAAACARIRERLDLTAWAASLMEHYELAARRPARPVRGAARVAPRPRVVTLVDHLGGHRGGAERIALELALGLAGRGRESVLCASRFTLDEVAKPTVVATLRALRAAEVRFVGLPRRRRWALWDWRELVRELRGRDVVLHAHKFGPNVAAAVIGRLWRVPVVVAHEHSFPPDEGRLRRLLTRWVVGRLADVVIAVSDVDRRRLVAEERLPRDRVVHVPNAIPPSRTAGTDVRAELGIPAAAPVAVSVGGLRPVKGFDVLVRAAAELRRALPQLRLLILGYGPGPDVIALRDLVASLGLEDAVAILGSRRDVADCLAAADVAVCSSRWEGSSLSVLEYMQAGKPVVATRVGGNPELLAGGGALLVDPDDPHALAAAIGEVLRDPVRAAAMGALNRRLCRERYAFETMVARVEGLYESRSGRRRGRRTPALARARARVLR
ncbi:MAG TPA: glycosyltransferase, partial [Solirubrobacteraceae bacterium]|nr:glycosyltransferase [Solirubrobacteraceae bacterium]